MDYSTGFMGFGMRPSAPQGFEVAGRLSGSGLEVKIPGKTASEASMDPQTHTLATGTRETPDDMDAGITLEPKPKTTNQGLYSWNRVSYYGIVYLCSGTLGEYARNCSGFYMKPRKTFRTAYTIL